jgi:hypothetical protein
MIHFFQLLHRERSNLVCLCVQIRQHALKIRNLLIVIVNQ